MITGGGGGTVQKGLKKVFFPEGWQQIERRQLSSIWSSKKELNWNKLLCKNKCWSRGWDIIPDQNWIQGWRNGVFWTLPQPRELRTLSQGRLKQSGIKQKKNISFFSDEILIVNNTSSDRVQPASFLAAVVTNSLEKEEGKLSWISLASGHVTLIHCYMCFRLWCFFCFVFVCWAGYLCLRCMCSSSFIHYFVCFVFLYLSVHVTYGFYARCLQIIKFSVTPWW